ncbi:hypothetical protein ACTA71_007249 [Dictyostelium dimigraforme]
MKIEISDETFKNILITGGAGFICYCMDKLNYSSNIKNLNNANNLKLINGDILDIQKVKNIVEKYDIDTIIHCAAESHVDNSFKNPKLFIETNILGTQSVLESCKGNLKIKKFIHVSTDEVYGCGKSMNSSVENKTVLKPTIPYSASKASAEHFVECYHRCFKVPTVIVRMNNVYGPKQYHEKLIPKFINLLSNNEKCTIHGLGENKRSFIYIDDVLSAFDIILNSNNNIVIGNTYNIGSDFEISILNVAKTLINFKSNGKINNIQYDNYLKYINDRPYNDFSYNIDYSNMVKLGWKKKVDWETGIKLTYNCTRVKRSADLVNTGKWWCLNHSKSSRGESNNDKNSAKDVLMKDMIKGIILSSKMMFQDLVEEEKIYSTNFINKSTSTSTSTNSLQYWMKFYFFLSFLEVVITRPRVDNTGFNIKLVVVDHNYK